MVLMMYLLIVYLSFSETYWGHQLVAKPYWDSYQTQCMNSDNSHSVECLKLETTILTGVGNLNPYALDYPVCTSSSGSKTAHAQKLWLLNSQFAPAFSIDEIKSMVKTLITPSFL